MKNLRLFIFSVFISYTFSHGQFINYPLQPGNRWEFNGALIKAVKDTLMTNGKIYALLVPSDTAFTSLRYERYDSNKVYRFNSQTLKENVWFDFTKEDGDTINRVPRSDDTLTIVCKGVFNEVILGTERKLFRFVTYTSKPKEPYYRYINAMDITDSLGIIRYFKPNDLYYSSDSLTISGAWINNQLIRTSYPYIYLPLHPGNWWKFDDGDIMSVLKDTLMPNGQRYALVDQKYGYYSKFLRQEKYLVYAYDTITNAEKIEMDMSTPGWQITDMYIGEDYLPYYFKVSTGIRSEILFSKNRKIYSYGGYYPNIWDAGSNYVFADSIGMIRFGSFLISEITEAYVNGTHFAVTSVNRLIIATPDKFILAQNYPNPFNSETHIKYTLPVNTFISLKVYNLLGQEVATLLEGERQAGNYSVSFDGSGLSTGVYYYRFISKDFTETKKLILMK